MRQPLFFCMHSGSAVTRTYKEKKGNREKKKRKNTHKNLKDGLKKR